MICFIYELLGNQFKGALERWKSYASLLEKHIYHLTIQKNGYKF